jgi:hypothetical protein
MTPLGWFRLCLGHPWLLYAIAMSDLTETTAVAPTSPSASITTWCRAPMVWPPRAGDVCRIVADWSTLDGHLRRPFGSLPWSRLLGVASDPGKLQPNLVGTVHLLGCRRDRAEHSHWSRESATSAMKCAVASDRVG